MHPAPACSVPLLKRVILLLALDTDLWTDGTWVVDSAPVECGRPQNWALANPKLDERQVLMAILNHDPSILTDVQAC